MTTPARVPGFYGRRPPKRAPAIPFSAIRRGAVIAPPGAAPVPPAAVDYIALLNGGWLMLGNGPDDTVLPGFAGCGDCVGVEWANTRRAVSTVLGPTATPPVTPHYPPWSQVLAAYRTQNSAFNPAGGDSTGPGSAADGGMDIQTFLEWLVANPGSLDGGTLIGFTSVDYTNPEEVDAAVAAGGLLWTGINVQAAQQTQFGNDQPWTPVAGSPVEGGHAVPTGGYGASAAGLGPQAAGQYKDVTWAMESSLTTQFMAQLVEEMWFLIWEEQLGTAEFQAGVDLAAFAAEYTAITGKPFPVAVPPPSPVPVPTPIPVPTPVPVPPAPVPPAPGPTPISPNAADVALNEAIGDWPEQHHMGSAGKIATALARWQRAQGFTGRRHEDL